MNQSQSFNLFFTFILIIINFTTLIASFSLQSFNNGDKDPNFLSNFTLLGHAQVTNMGNFVNLTSSSFGSSFGQIVYKKPFKFLDLSSSKVVSFRSEFSFSITSGDGDGIMFVIFPNFGDFSRVFDQGYFGLSDNVADDFVAVEFDTKKDVGLGDLDGNHVGVDVGSIISSVISYDLASIGLVLNSGVVLRSWIDYDGVMKNLEVWLAEDGAGRPENPLISCHVDLSRMWGDRDVLVGISSSSRGELGQISSLLSWSFEVSVVSSTLHSESLSGEVKLGSVRDLRRKKSCFLAVLGTVIFATGCGTLVAFLGLFAWVVVFGRHSNVVPELCMNPVDFKYEKVDVTVDNNFMGSSTR
ncbi:hypothetical protein vseg_005564 [Gypsophila vaccaria]